MFSHHRVEFSGGLPDVRRIGHLPAGVSLGDHEPQPGVISQSPPPALKAKPGELREKAGPLMAESEAPRSD